MMDPLLDYGYLGAAAGVQSSRPSGFDNQVDHFVCQMTDLENEISKRQQIGEHEAKIFYDHLTTIYEKLKAIDTQSNIYAYRNPLAPTSLSKIREVFVKAINLKIKLTELLPSTKSTLLTEAKGIRSQIKQSETEKILRKQNFLIRQIQSLEVQENVCSTKAEVMYDQISQLYNSFILNQMQIEELSVDDSAIFSSQHKISTEIQAKVIEFQMKLKKIIKSAASKPISQSDESNSNSKIRSLSVCKTTSQSEQIPQSSESEDTLRSIDLRLSKLEDLCSDILYLQQDTDNSANNSEILDSLNDNYEVSKDIQKKVTCLEEAQRELREDYERREENILDKLNEILPAKKYKRQTTKGCTCIICDPLIGRIDEPCTSSLIQYPFLNLRSSMGAGNLMDSCFQNFPNLQRIYRHASQQN